MMLGVLDQASSEPVSPMRGCNYQRAQQRIGAVELYADDTDESSGWTDIEEILHVVICEIGRWKLCALQESNDVGAMRCLMDCRQCLHG
jgi:uncharacterized protein (DUF2252 family)